VRSSGDEERAERVIKNSVPETRMKLNVIMQFLCRDAFSVLPTGFVKHFVSLASLWYLTN